MRLEMHFSIILFVFVLIIPAVGYADCANPPGVEGDQLYNADHKDMQFCDGTQWWSMKGHTASLPTCAEGDGIVMTSAGYWDCSPGESP